jgi:ABC-type tungstate transport system substrate-binding protein
VPSICYGLRGLVYFQIDVRGTKSDLHSGSFGGAVANPAMVLAQVLVALPLVAGFSRAALDLLDPDLALAMRADGAGDRRVGYELARAAGAPVLVAVAAGFGRAISEVGASLMVGGNILGQTRILTTTIALETSKGEFALSLALGLILLALAFLVNVALGWGERARPA